jgi:hypothetical protein
MSTLMMQNGVVTGHECTRPELSRSRAAAGIHPVQPFTHNIIIFRIHGQKKRRRTKRRVLKAFM